MRAYNTPSTEETAPITIIVIPHHSGPLPIVSMLILIKPYIPVFIITPDINAEIFDGVAGCAFGSHV